MTIKGKLVTLRPIRLNDAARYVQWLSDSSINQFLIQRNISLREERKWIKNLAKVKTDKIFAIDTAAKIHIGSVGLHQINLRNRRALFAIMIGDKNYWNKGYGSDATKTILRYAFETLKLHRVYLTVFNYNPRAIHVYKKLGFKTEGQWREHVHHKGKFHNEILMGILDREWKKLNS